MISKEDRISYIILIALGILAYIITFFIGKDFILAKNKFYTDAVLVDVKVSEQKKLKNKEDREEDPLHKYNIYYEYDLTWEYVNPNSEKKYRFESERESQTKNSFSLGDKEPVFIYYNDDEADYEFADPFGALIFLAAGTLLIIISVMDIVSIRKKAGKASASVFKKKSSRPHPVDATAALVIKSSKKTVYAVPESSVPSKMFINLLSKGEISASLSDNKKGEYSFLLLWHVSVSPPMSDFQPGDIILYKDKLSIVYAHTKTYAVCCAKISNIQADQIKDHFRDIKRISLNVEWSE